MIKEIVSLDRRKKAPTWARNYIAHHHVFFDSMKKCRNSSKNALMKNVAELHNALSVTKQIKFNRSGDVVFFWKMEAEKTFFILKWG